MSLTVKQLSMYSQPNDFVLFEAGKPWEVTSNSAATLWFIFQTVDELPLRRYLVTTGYTVKAKFQRAKQIKVGQPDTAQTFSVDATALTGDRSIWSISLTAAQAALLVAGTVVFEIYNGSTLVQSIPMSYFIKKIIVGCGS